jgi:hypothetical protein
MWADVETLDLASSGFCLQLKWAGGPPRLQLKRWATRCPIGVSSVGGNENVAFYHHWMGALLNTCLCAHAGSARQEKGEALRQDGEADPTSVCTLTSDLFIVLWTLTRLWIFKGGLMYSVKEGGPSPAANAALAQLLQQAKDTDVPKEIIDRNIKKASEKGQQDFV